jgi:hypothetical protein
MERAMNIGSSTPINPALAAMLSQLSSANRSAAPFPAGAPTGSSGAASSAVTGTGKAPISDAILDMFTKLHQASGGHAHGAGGGAGMSASAATTTASTASTMIDPLQQLMAAIDIDEGTEPDSEGDPNAAFQSYLLSQNPSSANGA